MNGPPLGTRAYELLSAAGAVLVLELPRQRPGEERLSISEAQVVAFARAGLSNAEIAQLRGVSDRTVGNQLANVYRKLGISGRSALG